MNGPFTEYLQRRQANLGDITTANLRALLLRDTSTYTYNPDHVYVADLFSNGAVEISVAGYSRQPLTSVTVTKDDANDRSVVDFDDVAFGSLPAGQTVAAVVFYELITSDALSPLMYYLDGKFKVTAAAPLAGASPSGNITAATTANPVVITSVGHGLLSGQKVYISGVLGMTQINGLVFTVANVTTNTFELQGVNGTAYTTYISGGTWNLVQTLYTDPLREAVNSGTSVTIGAHTGVVRAAAAKGDRTLSLSAVSGAIALGDNGIIQSSLGLPAALGAGNFNVVINAAGFLAIKSTY